jgi:hypothetical protein
MSEEEYINDILSEIKTEINIDDDENKIIICQGCNNIFMKYELWDGKVCSYKCLRNIYIT